MRRVLLALAILGTLGTWGALASDVKELILSVPGTQLDWPFLCFVLLQAVAFPSAAIALFRDLRENPPGAEPPVEQGNSDSADVVPFIRAQRRRLQWIVASPLLVMGGCLGYVVIESGVSVSEQGKFKACNYQLRALDAAIEAYVREKTVEPETLAQVLDASAGGKMPVCPDDGTYSLTAGDRGQPVARCSVHGTLEHPAPAKHPFM